jgi:hypothetical protein
MTSVHLLVGAPPALWGVALVVVGLVMVDSSVVMVGLALAASFGVQTAALHARVPSRTRRLLFVLSFVMAVIPLNNAFAHLRVADDMSEAGRARLGIMVFTTIAVGSGMVTVMSLRRLRQETVIVA